MTSFGESFGLGVRYTQSKQLTAPQVPMKLLSGRIPLIVNAAGQGLLGDVCQHRKI